MYADCRGEVKPEEAYQRKGDRDVSCRIMLVSFLCFENVGVPR